MNRTIIIGLSCLFLLTEQGISQKPNTTVNLEKTPRGISWQAWEKMNERWQPYSTKVFIQKNDGSTVEGQLTWMSDNQLMVQKNFDLPNGLSITSTTTISGKPPSDFTADGCCNPLTSIGPCG